MNNFHTIFILINKMNIIHQNIRLVSILIFFIQGSIVKHSNDVFL